ncbi:MAG: PF20097 family protein [Dysosmobacter sp.]|nr:PF20097 family protein [Dysosmobacter sp.]
MDCPFCGLKMEEGVLQSMHGIHFYKEPCLTGVPFNFKARYAALGQSNVPFQPPYITVSRCSTCRKIIFDY